MLELEERVDSLEAMFGRFIINSDNTLRRLENLMIDMRQQAEQDRAQTDQRFAQMQQQAEQDRQQAEQDRERADQRFAQMQQQAEQDRKRTEQMLADMRQQAEQDRGELNKKWGDLANRLGTVAEDIVAPNLPRLAREQFGCPAEPDDFMVRRWVRHKVDNSIRREFDVVVVYPKKVLINETKATPRINYIDDFIAVMADIYGYFPEYQGKEIIPIFAGLFIPDNLLRYLTQHRIYALGMGEQTMELLNWEQLTPSSYSWSF
ncbi:MAG: hypothetical protein HC877_17235 [Thioploca sp.]|nr:hypothetical protein [Thioploca sp.]